uniref:Uncharacterized protein n=2 Tax=Sus scrofa TaxID=9823 RepID=A0A8D0T9R2_PIG
MQTYTLLTTCSCNTRLPIFTWEEQDPDAESREEAQEEENLPHLDAGAAALAHRIRDGRPWRVNHGHEAHEAEVVGGEVDVITVEGKALRELLLRQVVMAETWCRDVGAELQPRSSLPPTHSCPFLWSGSPVGREVSHF